MRALLVLLVLALPVAGQGTVVDDVRFEHFHPATFSPDDFVSSCSAGAVAVSPDGRSFTFFEAEANRSMVAEDPVEGYADSGCGRVLQVVPVPDGAQRMSVRFTADRTVDEWLQDAGAPIYQEIRVVDGAGLPLQVYRVFPPDAGSKDPQEFRFTGFDVSGHDEVIVDWRFEDPGYGTAGGPDQLPYPVSGQRFRATVADAVFHFSVPAGPDERALTTGETRAGTLLTTEHRLAVQVPDDRAVHVQVEQGLELIRVEGPNGAPAPIETFHGEGLLGYDHDAVMLALAADHVQATVPVPLVAAEGPGEYTFVFQESSGLQVQPPLIPLYVILLAAPLPFAFLALVESRAFRREAFGGYARSAAALQWAVGVVFVYYVTVVLAALAGGRLDLMAVSPMPVEGVLLYVQVIVAGIAFTVMWRVARELYRIVRPRQAARAPGSDDAL